MSHEIPWDDGPYAVRPDWLPFPGEPIDLATARTLMDAYQATILAALDDSAQELRARHKDDAITIRLWTPDEVVQFWGEETDDVLVGYVMIDDQGHSRRFRSVLVSIDKASGEVIVLDETRLLDNPSE